MLSFPFFHFSICEHNFFFENYKLNKKDLGFFSVLILYRTEKMPADLQNKKLFICEICNYSSSKQSNLNIHLSTSKHLSRTKLNAENAIENASIEYNCKFCNRKYKARNSLWYHEKKCNENETITITDSSSNEFKMLTSLVLELVKSNTELQKQNQDFQKQMLDVYQKIQPINMTNNTTINANNSNNNNNNKTFNLQFFLNEQCKDAMNLSDFVKSVQLSLPDLEKVDEQGYVIGMSNLIISKLNELDIYKRPVHCSDAKRDTMHVKEDDKWEREDPANSKLTVAVKDIEKKNFLLLNDYKEKYPDCLDLESIHNDKYLHMMMTLAASGENEYKKVVKKIAKEVTIEKE